MQRVSNGKTRQRPDPGGADRSSCSRRRCGRRLPCARDEPWMVDQWIGGRGHEQLRLNFINAAGREIICFQGNRL